MKESTNLNNQPSSNEMRELESLFKLNDFDSLENKVRKFIKSYPKVSNLYNILGVVLQKKNNLSGAIKSFTEAIRIKPNFEQAHNNLGNILQDAGKFDEAAKSYERAVKLEPNNPEFNNNLGIAFIELGKYEEARVSFKKAIKLNPNYAEAYSNLGNSLKELGKFDEAITNHQKALKLNPKYKKANFNEALVRLTLGDFKIGWEKYELRLGKGTKTPLRYPSEKIWNGNYLNGTLLVWGEQGLGDHIMFCAILIDLKKYAKNIILEVDNRLENLLKRYFEKVNFSNIKIFDPEKTIKDSFDKHIAIGSLGQYLRKSKKSFETTPKKYLISSPEKEKELQNKFFQNKKFKVGISWKTLNKRQQFRSIELKQMLPIFLNQNCDFIDLQFGKFDEDARYLKSKHGVNIKSIDEIDNYNDIDSLAALINCLDLVISIDNTTAHLAGALGKKTWLMLAKNAKWHWFKKDEKKSLWYSSVKIFQQVKIGEWDSIIGEISNELKSLSK